MLLIKNFISNYVGKIFVSLAHFIFVPFYIHYLGFSNFGLISIYTVLLSVLSIFNSGLSAAFNRVAAQGNDFESLKFLKTSERIVFIILFLIAVTLASFPDLVTALWADNEVNSSVIVQLMLALIVPQIMFGLYLAGLYGLQHHVTANTVNSLLILIRNGMVIPVLIIMPDIEVFFAWQLVVTLTFAIIIRKTLMNRFSKELKNDSSFDWSVLRKHQKYIIGLFYLTIISTANSQLDKIILISNVELSALGVYTSLHILAMLTYSACVPICITLFPAITNALLAGNEEKRKFLINTMFTLIMFVSVSVFMLLISNYREIINIWIPILEMTPTNNFVAVMLLFGGQFLALQLFPYYLMLSNNMSMEVSKITFYTLLFMLPVMFYFVTEFGTIGASAAWLLSNIINFILLVYLGIYKNGILNDFTFLKDIKYAVTIVFVAILIEFSAMRFELSILIYLLVICGLGLHIFRPALEALRDNRR